MFRLQDLYKMFTVDTMFRLQDLYKMFTVDTMFRLQDLYKMFTVTQCLGYKIYTRCLQHNV